ncbi:TPA: site-specific integrase [Streptococcus equi subsp. zooepidemicus]|nr:site-specific integrase [Streptococcus equi subsp. zooepidemicus]
MSEKRRDHKNRLLHTGESQRKDGRYVYKYVDAHGKTKFAYAWTLVATDRTPQGKRKSLSLREKEKIIRKELEDGICSLTKNMTVYKLYHQYTRYKANVRENTKQGRLQLAKTLEKDEIGQSPISQVKISDAKEWVLRMNQNGYCFQTISNYKRSLKAAFYMAVQEESIRKNPFDFPISDVLEDNRKPKTPLSAVMEENLLSFLKTDKVYRKYYNDVVILLGTGLRISELCGLTMKDIDLDKKCIHVNHQLLKHSDNNYAMVAPKTSSGIRKIPMSTDVYHAITRVVNKNHRPSTISVDGHTGFLFTNTKANPRTSADYASSFRRMARKYNKQHPDQTLPSPFTAHSLRHTFCTKLAHSGMNPKALQYIMGHKNISMTLNYYAHTDSDMAVNEMKKHIA